MFDIISIDWGTKYCGLAVADSQSELILPLEHRVPTQDILIAIEQAVRKYPTQIILLGRPTNFQNRDTAVSTQIDNFLIDLKSLISRLNSSISIQVVNERGTTQNASKFEQEKFMTTPASTKSFKKIKDSLSAAKIAEIYFQYYKR